MEPTRLKENVILVDADYVDNVVYDLSETFEQMLFRHLPKADLALWLVCAALDGGVPEGENTVQVIFISTSEKKELEGFTPGLLDEELDGLAFHDPSVGEFLMSSVVDGGSIMYDTPLMEECVKVVLEREEVRRLIVIPEMEASGPELLRLFAANKTQKEITLLSMRPVEEKGFHHVPLGYSLMHALGIKSDELT